MSGAADFRPDLDAVASIAAVPTILDVVCRVTGMGFAAVARVTEDRWIACSVQDNIAFGLKPGGELEVKTTICDEIRDSHRAVVIDHVAEDPAFAAHHTPAMYGLQSYISMPIIRADGSFFGTLCAIDPKPHRVNTPEIVGMFKLFAELIAFHLDTHERLAASNARLMDERHASVLREQFIAVLGHDLRNPLASIDGGMRLIGKTPLNARATELVGMIQTSVRRMAGIIDNVLDFAHGRLGDGVKADRQPVLLGPGLEHVVTELRTAHPGREIDAVTAVDQPVHADPVRLGQLLSNLLGNALTHGAEDAPVTVRATTSADILEISVANRGDPIPPAAMQRLFQPFERGAVRPSLQGLGLGLYISAEIARAHGGTLDVTSTSDETRFTFRMPIG